MRGDRTPGQGLWSCQTRGDAWQWHNGREPAVITHTKYLQSTIFQRQTFRAFTKSKLFWVNKWELLIHDTVAQIPGMKYGSGRVLV